MRLPSSIAGLRSLTRPWSTSGELLVWGGHSPSTSLRAGPVRLFPSPQTFLSSCAAANVVAAFRERGEGRAVGDSRFLSRLSRVRNDKNLGVRSGPGKSGAPDSLLGVEGREHYRFVVNCGGVLIDRRGGLGAEVAVAGIEVEGADVMGAARAGELHAALDASDGVVSLHNSSVVVWQENGAHVGGAAKVMRARWLGIFNLGES
jgi:hypothetical protein